MLGTGPGTAYHKAFFDIAPASSGPALPNACFCKLWIQPYHSLHKAMINPIQVIHWFLAINFTWWFPNVYTCPLFRSTTVWWLPAATWTAGCGSGTNTGQPLKQHIPLDDKVKYTLPTQPLKMPFLVWTNVCYILLSVLLLSVNSLLCNHLQSRVHFSHYN